MFVNYSHPSQLRESDFRRLVSSQASKRRVKSAILTPRQPPGPLRWRQRLCVGGGSPQTFTRHAASSISAMVMQNAHDDETETPTPPLSPRSIDGLRIDPFNSVPISFTPHVRAAVDYYTQVWVPALAAGNGGTASASAALNIHFPWAVQDADRFEALVAFILCCMMSHDNFKDLRHPLSPIGRALLRHRGHVLSSLNLRLTAPHRRSDDTAIHAVCVLMTIDFLLGNDQHLEVHSKGLAEMVRLRGGADGVGMDVQMEDSVASIQFRCSHALATDVVRQSNMSTEIFLEFRADLSRMRLSTEMRSLMVCITHNKRSESM